MVVVDSRYAVTTKRLFIRPLAVEDAQDIHLMRSHPEAMIYTSTGHCDDFENTVAWIRDCLYKRDDCWNFSIELLPTICEGITDENIPVPRVIGLIGTVRTPEIGYMLTSGYHGKGYATEALQAFLPLFFEHFSGGEQGRYEYAEACTDSENIQSQHVLCKVGFELIERREKDFDSHTLGWRDTYVYRKLRPDHFGNIGHPSEILVTKDKAETSSI